MPIEANFAKFGLHDLICQRIDFTPDQSQEMGVLHQDITILMLTTRIGLMGGKLLCVVTAVMDGWDLLSEESDDGRLGRLQCWER